MPLQIFQYNIKDCMQKETSATAWLHLNDLSFALLTNLGHVLDQNYDRPSVDNTGFEERMNEITYLVLNMWNTISIFLHA